MQRSYVLKSKQLLMICLGIFFIVAPTETAMKTEQYYYVLCGVLAVLCWFGKGLKVRADYSLTLVFYLLYSYLTCIWTPNTNISRYVLVKTIAILFLFITIQFEYSEDQYRKIKLLLIIQQFVLLGMFIFYGRIDWDGRLWIGSGGISTDPNSYTMWTIIPLCFLIEKITEKDVKILRKIIYIVCMLATIYVVMMSGSRSGIIINIVAGALSLLFRFKDDLRRNPSRSIWLLLLIIVLAFVVYTNIPEVTLRRFAASDTRQLGGRTTTWSTFLSKLNEHPWGYLVGLGEYSTVYYSKSGAVAHSVIIEILFSQGLIGLSLVLFLLYKAFRNIWIRDKYAGIGYMCTAVMSATLSEFTSRPVMTMLFLGSMLVVTEDNNT